MDGLGAISGAAVGRASSGSRSVSPAPDVSFWEPLDLRGMSDSGSVQGSDGSGDSGFASAVPGFVEGDLDGYDFGETSAQVAPLSSVNVSAELDLSVLGESTDGYSTDDDLVAFVGGPIAETPRKAARIDRLQEALQKEDGDINAAFESPQNNGSTESSEKLISPRSLFTTGKNPKSARSVRKRKAPAAKSRVRGTAVSSQKPSSWASFKGIEGKNGISKKEFQATFISGLAKVLSSKSGAMYMPCSDKKWAAEDWWQLSSTVTIRSFTEAVSGRSGRSRAVAQDPKMAAMYDILHTQNHFSGDIKFKATVDGQSYSYHVSPVDNDDDTVVRVMVYIKRN